ncbi:Malonyl CoA-acyl carrier protein transacylase [Paraliobacillus sp. PM-2]|uniref:ACP S-malonyltransferase n=1 Tax=Paraliobacillus sp. PM-2 TaxID=1462524 RepID=UPI00061C0074|nr:ACP S-malonyltransferase [Paraliobacillus sp. PM-2]CQR47731.1 Malonyl CoA-acyl carrier protein transacylase [Paraliobacillus sp. PM-2]
MKKVAFVYPGQGSQQVGMGETLYHDSPLVQSMFEQADSLLDINLTKLMFEGPKETLTQTEHAQPALLLTSCAITKQLEEEGIIPSVVAGHSLGEYSALVAAGAISFEDALPLVQTRGKLMEQAYPKGKGAMAAVLGLEQNQLQSELDIIAQETDEVIEIANLNCPGQIVISGDNHAIDLAITRLKEAGAKRVLSLSVSGPFHSSLMKPAAESFASSLEDITINDITLPAYANVTAEKVTKHTEIKQRLVEQLFSTVRFEEIIRDIIESDVDAIVEVGSGKVLTGLVKKINRRMKTFTVQDSESLADFVEWYKEEK